MASTMRLARVRCEALLFTAMLLGAGLATAASGAIPSPWDSPIVVRGGSLTSAYRYVGPGEAQIIEKTGLVPNTTRLG